MTDTDDVALPVAFVQGIYLMLLRIEAFGEAGALIDEKLLNEVGSVISALNVGLLDRGLHPHVKP